MLRNTARFLSLLVCNRSIYKTKLTDTETVSGDLRRCRAGTASGMLAPKSKAALKRVRDCMDCPCQTELQLMREIRELLSIEIPIVLSRMAICHPIAMLGSASYGDGAPFREVVDVSPFLEQLMCIQSGRKVALGVVLKYVSPAAIRPFSHTPCAPYWMNTNGAYKFPPMTALSLTSTFSAWDSGGTTCVYSVATKLIGPGDHDVVFVPTQFVPSNVLPLYLIQYSVGE